MDEQRVYLLTRSGWHVRHCHEFLTYRLFLSYLGRSPERDARTRWTANFLRSGTSTYQRSCKINFFTITTSFTRTKLVTSCLSLYCR